MSAKQKKNIYTAAEVAVLENKIQEQQAQIEELKRKLEHMNECLANAQRARFGQSSEKQNYVLGKDQLSLFNEAEKEHEYSAPDCAPRPLRLSIHSGGIEQSRRWR